MRTGLTVALITGTLSVLGAGNAHAEASPPAGLLGTWDVEKVEVDRQDQMHWGVRPGDPRLLGRELVITQTAANLSEAKGDCSQKIWKSLSGSWADLFAKGFPRPPGGGRSTRPKPADFEFKPPNAEPVTVYLLCPYGRSSVSDLWATAKWVAPVSSDTLVMHYDAQVLLVLKRRSADARPRASFPCEKASSPTEKAICGTIELASLDRSVATAYRDAIARNRDREEQLRAVQRTWLKERDACGAVAQCLREAMQDRIESLTM